MSQRVASLSAVGLVLTATAMLLATLAAHGLQPGENGGLPLALEQLQVVAFAFVGALLLHRRPEHRIGWLLAATGTANVLALAAEQFADVASRVRVGSADVIAVIDLLGRNVQEVSLLLTFVLLPALFPTGRVHADGWRWLPRTALVTAGVSAVVVLLVPDHDALGRSTNPLGIESLRGPLELVAGVTFAFTLLLAFPAIAALVARYRAAEGVERLQLRWFTLSLVVLAACFTMMLVWVGLWNIGLADNPSELTFDLVVIVPMMGMPLSIAAAVLRYRLYDVERILSRTVSYAALSLVLAGSYAAVVLSAQAVLGRRGDTPDLVVAGATLLAAASFQPVRRRVQTAVDARFNRAGYDAQRTVSAFASRLRDQVHLQDLTQDLATVVDRTVAPRHASLWLRSPTHG